MEINEKSLEVLAAGLKLSKDDLAKGLESGEIDLSDRVIYTKSDFETYQTNLKNKEYHSGKEAGYEMPLKESKKKFAEAYGIETEGIKDYDSLIDLVLKSETEKLKALQNDGATDKQKKFLEEIEAKETKIKELQSYLKDKETEFETKLAERDQRERQTVIDRNLSELANTLPIEVPKHISIEGDESKMRYLQAERQKFLIMFKAKYDFEIKDGELIIKDGDKVIEDRLFNPEKPSNVALNFAKSNYFNIKDKEFINRSDSNKYGNDFKGMSGEQFDNLMKDKGIKANSLEWLKYRSEWRKENK